MCTARRPQRKNRGEQASSVWRMNAPRSPRGTASALSPQDQVELVATRSQLHRPRVPPNLGALERLAVERAGLVEVGHIDADLHRRHSGARYPTWLRRRRATAAGRPRRSKCTCHGSLVTHGSRKWHSPDPTPPPSVLGLGEKKLRPLT